MSTLQFYLQHGLKLQKVHRCIESNQSQLLKQYIELNTQKRTQAKHYFEKGSVQTDE